MSKDLLRNDMMLSTQSSAVSSSALELLIPLVFLVFVGAALATAGGGSSYYYESMYPGYYVSDAKFKTDIVRVGQTRSGLPLYHYRYQGFDEVFEGVMAQDLLKLRPDAVKRLNNGTLLVNYDAIDAELKLVKGLSS